MSSGGSISNSAEGPNSEGLVRSPSPQEAIYTADNASGDQKGTSQDIESIPETNSTHESQDLYGAGTMDASLLRKVQSSVDMMSSGIEELATTVRDFLALDAGGDSSDDYEHDSGGKRVQIAWGKLRSAARRRRRMRAQMNAARYKADTSDGGSENEEEGSKKHPQIIPGIRECDLDHFQSKPAGDEQKVYCVDFLIGGDELPKESRQFLETSAGVKSGKIEYWKPGHVSDRTKDSSSEGTGKKWIRRIRINSRAVLELIHLMSRGKTGRPPRPIVFRRPFQLLVSLHEALNTELANIKTIVSEYPKNQGEIKPPVSSTARGDSWARFVRRLGENKHAIDEISCFVEFMETRIMPDVRRYRDPVGPLPKTIRYEDLWYLFKPGDLVFVPEDTSREDPFRSTPSSQQFLRVIQTSLGPNTTQPVGLSAFRHWSLLCHFIEHDGTSFAPVHVLSTPFARFSGERNVTGLPFYPTSYLEDDQRIAQAQAEGETYIRLIERRSGFYSGWTQTMTPLGDPVSAGHGLKGTPMTSPEHIESEILVDFQETFNAFPSWKPDF
ncbi:hypothetical protein DHEL01_v200632 [Diaporthe helianthi]|uniref:DUF7025 domain-containing protein n=1 Tax=Diaporthe helianthi TaxID=158607 RepID=A0A2P5IEN3_DIAHE|nr:hypothetical protein DHEL01_v200632 [Diaporthe helianthi]